MKRALFILLSLGMAQLLRADFGSLVPPSGGGGSGDMLSTNNLSDVVSAATSRTNLGATTVGANIFSLTNPGAITFLRMNANNTVTARSAANMASDLSLVIGTNVEAWDADLDTYAGITPSANVQTFLGAANYAAMKTQLALTIGTNVEAWDADLDTYAGITPSANVQTFLGAANYAAMKTQLALTIGTNVEAWDTDLDTWAAITRASGFDTFAATPSSANFFSLITNETGSGAVVGGTAPTISALNLAAGSASAASWPILNSGTVLTTPEAGAMENDGVSLYFTNDTTTSRTKVANYAVFHLTADGSAVSTGGDFFGSNSSFSAVANGYYRFCFDLYFTKTTAGTVQFGILNSAAAYTNINATWVGCDTTGIAAASTTRTSSLDNSTTAAGNLPATSSLTTAVEHHYLVYGTAQMNGAGTLRMRITTSAGTVTPRRESSYTIERIPAGNVGTFAP